MRSHGKWFAGLMIGLLGGCFASYGYNDFDGEGAGGAGGANAVGGSSNNGGSSSSSSSGTGGKCPIRICGEPTNSTCNQDAPCMQLAWAHRFGLGQTPQAARNVALDKNDNVIIAGNYSDQGFQFIGKNMDGPSVPDTATPSITQGYVARLNSSGIAEFALSFNGDTIHDVAVDGKNDIVIAGISSAYLILKKITLPSEADAGADPTIGSSTDIIGGTVFEITTNAITIDDDDNIYIVGTNNGIDGKVNCPTSTMRDLYRGMFVIKFDKNLACQWIHSFKSIEPAAFLPTAISAKNALGSGGGIWITGTFKEALQVAAGMTYTPDASPDMFLISLSANSGGKPIKSFRYGNAMDSDGILKPLAIEVDSSERVYVAGEVEGKTSFHEELFEDGQRGAFVATIASDGTDISTVFTSTANNAMHVARATGISLVGDKVFVAGAFSGAMNLNPPNELTVGSAVGNATNSPFLAILDAAQLQLITFDAYDGGGESFATTGVHLAASSNAAVLAGAWIKALDFSTMPGDLGTLSEFPDATPAVPNPDIFVAKFTP